MLKKLLESEGVWDTRKEILGWIFDGITRCIELPGKKSELIGKTIKTILRKRKVKFNEFEKLVEKMRHAALVIPGSLGLFTPINQLFLSPPK